MRTSCWLLLIQKSKQRVSGLSRKVVKSNTQLSGHKEKVYKRVELKSLRVKIWRKIAFSSQYQSQIRHWWILNSMSRTYKGMNTYSKCLILVRAKIWQNPSMSMNRSVNHRWKTQRYFHRSYSNFAHFRASSWKTWK